jgi:hypothetical protein
MPRLSQLPVTPGLDLPVQVGVDLVDAPQVGGVLEGAQDTGLVLVIEQFLEAGEVAGIPGTVQAGENVADLVVEPIQTLDLDRQPAVQEGRHGRHVQVRKLDHGSLERLAAFADPDGRLPFEEALLRLLHGAVGLHRAVDLPGGQQDGPAGCVRQLHPQAPGEQAADARQAHHQVLEYATGIHGGELVLVAQQDEAGLGLHGLEEAVHENQVDHGGFVHDHQIR